MDFEILHILKIKFSTLCNKKNATLKFNKNITVISDGIIWLNNGQKHVNKRENELCRTICHLKTGK
jgi:hypothetical protein